MVGTSTNPLIGAVASTTVVESVEVSTKAPQTVKERVNEFFKENPIMAKVAWCESRFRQFDKNGEIFRGKINQSDVGVMQINTYYHGDIAKKMGLDLMTLEGNLAYGKYLFEKEGTTPWNSSSPCWRGNDEVAVVK